MARVINKLYIKNGVTHIGAHAFEDYYFKYPYPSVELPNSVVSIGGHAFYNSDIGSITIPDSVTYIGEETFMRCSELSSVTLGNGVTHIGANAFNSVNISSIFLSNNITSIGEYAFGWCNLTSLTIPKALTVIDKGVFAYNDFSTITIPDGVTQIKEDAFYGCAALKDVHYGGTEEQWKAITIDPNGNDPLLNATIHYTEKPTTTTAKPTTTTAKKPPVAGTTTTIAGGTTGTVNVPSVGSTTSGTSTGTNTTATAGTTAAPEKLMVLVQTDSATVEATPDAFPKDAVVKLEALATDALSAPVKGALLELAKKFVAYEITATAGGAAVQPDGTVKGTFAIPAEYDLDKVAVLYVSPDGKTETIASTIDRANGKIVAELRHFSTYVVAELDEAVVSTTTTAQTTATTDADMETPDDDAAPGGFPWAIVIVLAAVVIAGGVAVWYFFIFRKK